MENVQSDISWFHTGQCLIVCDISLIVFVIHVSNSFSLCVPNVFILWNYAWLLVQTQNLWDQIQSVKRVYWKRWSWWSDDHSIQQILMGFNHSVALQMFAHNFLHTNFTSQKYFKQLGIASFYCNIVAEFSKRSANTDTKNTDNCRWRLFVNFPTKEE